MQLFTPLSFPHFVMLLPHAKIIVINFSPHQSRVMIMKMDDVSLFSNDTTASQTLSGRLSTDILSSLQPSALSEVRHFALFTSPLTLNQSPCTCHSPKIRAEMLTPPISIRLPFIVSLRKTLCWASREQGVTSAPSLHMYI